MKKLFSLTSILIVASLVTIQAQDTLIFNSPLEINGIQQTDSILCVKQNGNYSTDVKHLMEATGGEFYPISNDFSNTGFATQYGKIISYARDNMTTGFYKSKPLEMLPPSQKIDYGGTLLQFAPINFLSKVLDDTIFFDETSHVLRVIIDPPDTIGCIIPEASALAKSLQDNGYLVRQAGIDLTNAITICNAGYAPDCNGNNAGFSYIIINMPPASNYDSLLSAPTVYNIRNDEAIIVIGRTPPKCKYFSFRSYLTGRYFSTPNITIKKIYASLGDATSCYSMNEDIPLSEMFERNFAIISVADSNIAYRSKQLILENTSIPDSNIYFDIIPADIYRFGFSQDADQGNFLHRVSIFENDSAGTAYVNNPTLEVLRVTPETPNIPIFLSTPALTSRISGINEFYLNENFEYFEQALFNEYNSDYDISFLYPSVWLMEGYQAIQQTANVLGEVRDALYIRTESFNFYEDDIIVVYGVNHTKTGKAVYTNVSCYRDILYAGFGGIKNNQYEKTARKYFADTLVADYFYTYKFTRDTIPNDTNVFIVPQDTANNLMGINYGDLAFMGFRAYIDTSTNVGPSPQEVIYSRAMVLRPKGSGFADIIKTSNIEFNIFPNPMNDFSEFEIITKKPTYISISVYNIAGQLIDQPVINKLNIGTEKIRWNAPVDLHRGIYLIRLYATEKGKNKLNCISKKVIVN
ncbi:MAG: T9SS type A sorting domain-containing protein [Candidatus Marithrix sp.]